MKIVAIMTVRNESLYLPIVLEHLYQQGVYVYFIDNESDDDSVEIAKTFLGKNVINIETISFSGVYEWERILMHKEKIAKEVQADWFIHHDGDEIREAPSNFKTLADGILHVDQLGYNAINFDEFVFIPTDEAEHFENTNFVREMKSYYFFEPRPFRRVNAWKNTGDAVDLKAKGGHAVNFDNRKIYPHNFILRHYITLSFDHLRTKYSSRIYSDYEVSKLGWHGKRACFSSNISIAAPCMKDLKILSDGDTFDKSDPKYDHLFPLR